jgi:dCMP deaminase
MPRMRHLDFTNDYYKDILVQCCRVAMGSPDMSTQNAAVLLDKSGPIAPTWSINEFPYGVQYKDERWERPGKYQWIEHAERNAIYAAASCGIATYGKVMVCPWAACADCARAIVQARVQLLVTMRPQDADTNTRWQESIAVAMTILEESDVRVKFIEGPLDMDFTILRDGKPFKP